MNLRNWRKQWKKNSETKTNLNHLFTRRSPVIIVFIIFEEANWIVMEKSVNVGRWSLCVNSVDQWHTHTHTPTFPLPLRRRSDSLSHTQTCGSQGTREARCDEYLFTRHWKLQHKGWSESWWSERQAVERPPLSEPMFRFTHSRTKASLSTADARRWLSAHFFQIDWLLVCACVSVNLLSLFPFCLSVTV